MAQRTVTQLIDDIDGKELQAGDGQTVTFAVGNATYEIDLSQKNLDKFYDALTPYMENGRKISGRRSTIGSPSTGAGSGPRAARTDKEQLQAIRDWARGQGMEVSSRGRISKQILDAFHAANN